MLKKLTNCLSSQMEGTWLRRLSLTPLLSNALEEQRGWGSHVESNNSNNSTLVLFLYALPTGCELQLGGDVLHVRATEAYRGWAQRR